MGRARSFAEQALRAIERRQMLCIGVTSAVALAIGTAGWLTPSGERLPAGPVAQQVPAFAARVVLLDELMFQGSLPRSGPVPTGCLIYTPLRKKPSRIPLIIRTPEFRNRLKLEQSESSVYIKATPNPETATVELTVCATSSGTALRIANLAAQELIAISREEFPLRIDWKHDPEANASPAARHHRGKPPNSDVLSKVKWAVLSERGDTPDNATCQVVEEARLVAHR